jgi:hypothetical protein
MLNLNLKRKDRLVRKLSSRVGQRRAEVKNRDTRANIEWPALYPLLFLKSFHGADMVLLGLYDIVGYNQV